MEIAKNEISRSRSRSPRGKSNDAARCVHEKAHAPQTSVPKWSSSEAAEKKVCLDMVWEVPDVPPEEQRDPNPDFAIAKYSKITPLNAALLDSYIDGYQRTTTLFFGRIVSNPDDLPAFEEPLGYNMTYNAMAHGNGNALHRHNSVEIFVALDAPFEIAYGSRGEFKALLQPWDLVACPAEAIHSYKNMGEDGGQILTFLCGKPAIRWADGVVNEARVRGAVCDDSGILLKHSNGNKDLAPNRNHKVDLTSKEAPELFLGDGDIDRFVFRFAEQAMRTLKIGSSAGTMGIRWKVLTPGEAYAPKGEEDTLIVVLGGSVRCHGVHYSHLDVIKQPSFLTAGLEPTTLLVVRSSLPHNLDFFFDADLMV